jgi:hypothetical protein
MLSACGAHIKTNENNTIRANADAKSGDVMGGDWIKPLPANVEHMVSSELC